MSSPARSALALAVLLVAGWTIAVARQAHFSAPDPTPILYDRNGTFLAQLGHVEGNRTEYGYWRIEAPPQRIVAATLALEDRRFWSHPGVDPAAVLRALWQHATGHGRSGASTIAMQVARLQNPRARTLWAKAVEAGTAVALTARYGHAAVLAQYLRLAPYGNGSHGIAHAARYYFDKPVPDLGWPEIALLAALPQAPARMNPLHASGRADAIRRGQRVLQALAAAGTLPQAELPAARAQLAALTLRPPPRRPDAIQAILRLGKSRPAADPADPRLWATLDLRVQARVGALLRANLATWHDAGAQQAAAIVVRRSGREVLASLDAGGSPAGIDFTRVPRSPGSTLKPFLYALALDRGLLRPDEVMQDRTDGAAGIGNADGQFLGPMLPRQALANSRNVPAATLLRRIGLRPVFSALRTLGLHDSPGPAERYGLSMAIGSLPSSLDRLVRAYAMLADGGRAEELTWLRGAPGGPMPRVIGEDTARLVTLFLSDPMARLPSFPRYGDGEFPFAVALKTGTSQGFRDAWTIAWSRDYLVGVWVGRADAGPMHGLSGARAAGSLANAILLSLHGATRGDLTAGDFPPPAHHVARELCADAACAGRLTEFVPTQPLPAADTVRLSIVAPETNSRIWRNPEVPAAASRLALKAASDPPVPQVVWLVDGEPVGTADPTKPFFWRMTPGAHRFQVRLPFATTASASVRVVVE